MTLALPGALYTAKQVRELDRLAIEGYGIPGIILMKRAGGAVLSALLEHWPTPDLITVYCGAGNNGGDGYIVAALARQKGLNVQAVAVAPVEKLRGDARRAFQFAEQEGVEILPLEQSSMPVQGVIVDALLGTGLEGTVRENFVAVIDAINQAELPVVSVDIPSGLCSDKGVPLGCCIKAALTVSFIGMKQGLLTGHGPEASGELVFDDLSVPASIYTEVQASCQQLNWSLLQKHLKPRPADAHKGRYGHVMVIGGDLGYGGAVILAAEAALRTGAGLVSVATRPDHVVAVLARSPEIMAVGVTSGQALEPWLDRPDVLVVGPGLGRSPWSEQLLQKAVAAKLPMVVDADALNIISEGRVASSADRSQWIMTPHPGEAARLLGISVPEVMEDRFAALTALQQNYGCNVLLKGAGTLVTATGGIALCPYGNPGMAVGGMGDLLSGVLGSLLAQGFDLSTALSLGVCIHALAGDDAALIGGQAGLVATDLLPFIRARVNGGDTP